QFIGHVERGHDGDSICAHHFSGVAYLAHLLVEVFGGVEQIGAFVLRAGNEVFLFQDPYGDGGRFLVAHAVCSMVFRRPIMASTRARTWSLRCANTERSAASDSWRCLKARFSSLRVSTVSRSSSTRRSSSAISVAKPVLPVLLLSEVSFMGGEYRAPGALPQSHSRKAALPGGGFRCGVHGSQS